MTNGETRRDTLATAEALGKAAVAVLGLIYALGLAVVTLHLARYGASGLGFLQEQYVLAGMWALLPLGAIGFVFAVIVAAALEEFGEVQHDPTVTAARRWRIVAGKLWQAAKVSGAWFIIAGFFLGFLTPRAYGLASIGSWALVKIGLQVAGFAAVLAIMTIGGLASFVAAGKRNPVVGTVLLGTALFVLLGYLGFFTASVYPLIPAALGGGQPRRIQILLKSDDASAAALLDTRSAGAPLPEHRLLFASDKAY